MWQLADFWYAGDIAAPIVVVTAPISIGATMLHGNLLLLTLCGDLESHRKQSRARKPFFAIMSENCNIAPHQNKTTTGQWWHTIAICCNAGEP
jgi:hypothetical protein